MLLAALLQQDPYLVKRTIAEAHTLLKRLNEVQKRLGTPMEQPGDLGLARETAHRIRSRQVLLLVLRDYVGSNPEIDFLCRVVPNGFDAPDSFEQRAASSPCA